MDWIMIFHLLTESPNPRGAQACTTQSSTSRAEKLCTDALKAMLTQFKTPDGEPDEDNVTRRLRATKGVGRDAGRAPAAPRGPRGSRCQSTRGKILRTLTEIKVRLLYVEGSRLCRMMIYVSLR